MNETTQPAIVQSLRETILAGKLSPSQRLVEAQLAQWLGVSRTLLRDSYRQQLSLPSLHLLADAT
ncbi:GntR family transcriptional regulator [Paraburkholderia sp. MMS20-SJTR3]|uniref:GntR family transcriptional regulator n=1 Tax=Paraburkholderia sejongensis TaxID=2886946 RepID=A0ABS8K1I4_9BURK|nr:GntR family transcriptional regulator [Paraburkholderia sp. MMS20-SJTR3]MCC8396010.1 GntR family transcriptional regulator [Paraburkholderia sp. MMS20-SJTR3]